MQVIGHHRESHHIDCKRSGQEFDAFAEPLAAMLAGHASERIDTSQKLSSDTAIDAVHHLNFFIRRDFPPIDSCHRRTPQTHARIQLTAQNAIPGTHRQLGMAP